MANLKIETSPKIYARIAGVLYLILILVGMFAVIFVRDKLIVAGDATASANNIMTSPLLWCIGITADLVMHVCDIGLCYLTNSFALLLAPEFAQIIFPAILIPAFIGELSFCLWLIVKGVNVPKWNERVNI
jgi:Domain of unknown function (DUF4386)